MLAYESSQIWRTGYISGAFDMFHIGHLNLIRRAKERCGRLIVGVLSDEAVASAKQKWPAVPLGERMEIVAAIKYVDEVDVTTRELLDKLAAWEKYRFDAMFSGDDHIDDGWTDGEDELKARGADLVFFPYTKDVSSSRFHDQTMPAKAEGAYKAQRVDGFRHLFPFDKVGRGERIVVYGTGDVGGQFAGQLEALGFCEIVAFADTYAAQGGGFRGKPCWTPEELQARAAVAGGFDRIVVASTTCHGQILGKLRTLGIEPGRIV